MRLVHSSAVADFAAKPGPSVAKFRYGQRVKARKNGDLGIIECRIAQSYASDLYVVIWDADAADRDMYGEDLLAEVTA